MQDAKTSRFGWSRMILATTLGLWAASAPASETGDAFLPRLVNSSTIPANGDAVIDDVSNSLSVYRLHEP